jgi:hypothetical protein
MIHHLSIAERNPQQAAEVLAQLMGGKAVPFPHCMTTQGEDHVQEGPRPETRNAPFPGLVRQSR